MLLGLTVRNFVIAKGLDLEFAGGFGVLTGETGAGKSIIVDALSFVTGGRGSAGLVMEGAAKAEVVASFGGSAVGLAAGLLASHGMEPSDELILRRTQDAGGRTRAFVNETPVTQAFLLELGGLLVAIHGQHSHHGLSLVDGRLGVLDAFGGSLALAGQTARLWAAAMEASDALARASEERAGLERERDLLEWEVGELSKLSVSEGEWDALARTHARLAHAVELGDGARFVAAELADGDGSAWERMRAARRRMEAMSARDAGAREGLALVDAALADLNEAAAFARRYGDEMAADPEGLAKAEGRMSELSSAAKRQRCDPSEIAAVLAKKTQRLALLEDGANTEALKAERESALAAHKEASDRLGLAREQAAKELSADVSSRLKGLGLGHGSFRVALVPAQAGPRGGETADFMVAGLSGSVERPMERTVSGGELSRLGLALQVAVSAVNGAPTMVFDEVDAGIGGGVAEMVGGLLRELGGKAQVLCVTHLPQVAARANRHWAVSKEVGQGLARSRVEEVCGRERVLEVARMLGGEGLTETAIRHASEMLAAGGSDSPSQGVKMEAGK